MIKQVLKIASVLFVFIVLIARYFASKIVTPLGKLEEPLTVLDFDLKRGTITHDRGEDSDLRGKFSLIFDGERGHAKVGDVLEQTSSSVTRKLIELDRGELRRGVSAKITGWWFDSPEQIGGEVHRIDIKTNIGLNPAWLITPNQAGGEHLAIHVHGRGSRKQETLRAAKIYSELKISSLVIGYRNDPDSAKPKDGKYGLGVTEANDLIAALHHAQNLGYKSFSIFAWSMGATITLRAVQKLRSEGSDLLQQIEFLVLESPAVDWPEILMHHGKLAKLPNFISKMSCFMIEKTPFLLGLRKGIPLSELTSEKLAENVLFPTLLITSENDSFVPFEGGLRLASIAESKVDVYRAPGGEHVKIWNDNESMWRSHVKKFIENHKL